MVKNPPANEGDARDMDSIPGSGISWRRKWQPTPVFLPGELHCQRSLVGYTPWGHKGSDMTEQTHTQQAMGHVLRCAMFKVTWGWGCKELGMAE